MKKALALLMACIMALGLLSACSKGDGSANPTAPPEETEATIAPTENAGEQLPDPALGSSYTFDVSCARLPRSWDPQRADTEAGRLIASLITSSLVKAQPEDTETGGFRWVYELAESVTDVTEEQGEKLKHFGSLREGEKGLAWEIKLDPEAVWENGERVTADDIIYSMKALLDPALKLPLGARFIVGNTALAGGAVYRSRTNAGGSASRSFEREVGFFKTDESTLVYICEAPSAFDEIMRLFSTPFVVYAPLHEKGDYCTSAETTLSCGPYRLESAEDGEITLTRSPRYKGWVREEDGSMTAFTGDLVNGEHILRYQTTRVILHELPYAAAEQELIYGRLTAWTPEGEDIREYSQTGGFVSAPTPYTSGIFFNTAVPALRNADLKKGDINSVVLSNRQLRRAISLSIDRASWCAQLGGTPCLGLINPLALYDPWNDPASCYCETEIALQSMCELYGMAYGEDAEHKSPRETAASITGYDAEKARELFALACDELEEQGLYAPGDTVKIRVACAGSKQENELAMLLLSGFVNAAAEGSGFGRFVFECIGEVNAEGAVAAGDFAMGYAPLYVDPTDPFDALRACCDPELYGRGEAECAGIAEKPLTLSVQGGEVTLSFAEWSRSMTGRGRFAEEPIGVRLQILASLEKAVIEQYCRIPVSHQYSLLVLNPKAQLLTNRYSPVYGLGGIEFTVYNYSDPEWESFIAENGGPIYK